MQKISYGRLTLLKTIFSLIFLLSNSAIFAQTADTLRLSLQDCEKLSLENNLEIEAAKLQINVARAKRTQARHLKILPKFELKHILGPSTQARDSVTAFGVLMSPDTSFQFKDLRYYTEIELNLLQPLYTFGKLSGIDEAATYGVQVEKANLDKISQDKKLEVRKWYWNLLLQKELLIVIQDAEKEMKKAKDKIDEKLEAGAEEVSQTDVFKLKIYQYEIKKRKGEILNKMVIAKARLRMAMGVMHDVKFKLKDEYLERIDANWQELPAYLEVAYVSRPDVAQLRAGLSARYALIKIAKSDYYPQFFFGAQIRYNYAKDRFDSKNPFVYNPYNFFRPGFIVGFNLNLNFVQTRDKVRVEEAEYKKLAHKEKLLSDGIKIDVQKLYLEAKQAEINMRESRRALKASESWLRSATMTFDIGLGAVKDVIDAYQAKGKMQFEHLENIYKFNVGIAKLGQAIGKDLVLN